MVKKEKKVEICSLFEEMLMWTSYRYAIGRKSYVSSLAEELPQHYYNRLTDGRKIFTASDIRKEIYDHLRWLPFNFSIDRMYNTDELNPISVLMKFIEREKISNMNEFAYYKEVNYNSHTDDFTCVKSNPTLKEYFSISDIDDLIPWETFASCFDLKNHKFYKGEEVFKTWKRKTVPVEGKTHYFVNAEFGWEPIWINLNSFLKMGGYCAYMFEKDIVNELKDIKRLTEI